MAQQNTAPSNLSAPPEVPGVKFYRAPEDKRVVAILVQGDFNDFEKFEPFMSTDEERKELLVLHRCDPDREAATNAHLTGPEWPIQLVFLKRDPGSVTLPHYHVNDRMSSVKTKHTVFICQRGRVRLGVYTSAGTPLGTAELRGGDLILVAEGHSVEFVDPDSRVVELRQGPDTNATAF